MIGVSDEIVGDKERPPMGAIVDMSEDKLTDFLFNVDFISPKMFDFVEKPRSAVFVLCAAF